MGRAQLAVRIAALTVGAFSCAPRARPLGGALSPVSVPRAELPRGYRQITFTWQYADADVQFRGDGVARVAAPDSVRLDLFLAGGLGGGRAFLIGDDLRLPDGEMLARLLPPPPLLWAALGRLSVPSASDTLVRVDGDTLRADIGRGPTWRSAFVGGDLRRLERIADKRVHEWVARTAVGDVRYQRPVGRRSLEITVVRTEALARLDATIWR
ncbi:MAG: hypothetical protein WKG32_21860 [Gemmatimonadaceae bacterium]